MAEDAADSLLEHIERPNALQRLQQADDVLQALQDKAAKAQENFEREEKLRKELEALNAKLTAEKTSLLKNLDGEKGALSEYQEKSAKLQAQKADLESQLTVSTRCTLGSTD